MSEAQTTDYGEAPPRGFFRVLTAINVFVYRLSGGRWMASFGGRDICMITMLGAKSKKTRHIPLMYVPHEEGVLLVASQGGRDSNPAWYYNLLANPDVSVEVHRERHRARARLLSGDEKARYWDTCVEHYPEYETYRHRTDREIPVFVCEPS